MFKITRKRSFLTNIFTEKRGIFACIINDDKLTNIEMMFWDLYGSRMELSLKL